jgi:molybdopterin/thiamine biosynthesis adenylyltransferase
MTDLPGYGREFDLLLPQEFPFIIPSVALAHAPPPLTWPHVEESGILCLLPNSTAASHRDAAGVVRRVLADAYGLVSDSLAGRTRDDFLHEFLSYWNRGLGKYTHSFVSLLEPRGPSRIISVWAGKANYLFGESDESVWDWLKNRYGKDGGTAKLQKAVLLWLDRPLYPGEYPNTALDVWAVARERTEDGGALLAGMAEVAPDRVVVLFGAQTVNGPCFAGVTVTTPQRTTAGGRLVSPLHDGFPLRAAPPGIVSTRYWNSGASVRRSDVERADPAWIHGRGQDPRQELLGSKTVAAIGCGSVGGPVATLLVKAGVRRIIPIDPEVFRRANTGRHTLGERHAERFKAIALAEELRENHPHINVEPKVTRWENVARLDPGLLESCDLIVSAIGDWGSESALNEWRRGVSSDIPIVYGWTEAHACAGHAVLIAGEGCFECGFDDTGLPSLQVTAWPHITKTQEPACGSFYQPYGPVELNNTITLVSELALDVLLGRVAAPEHRVRACRRRFLEDCGGEWTPEWMAVSGGRAEGAFELTRPWPKSRSCVACRAREAAA